jgi:dihydrofolate synthase/folylpolyglutamate synthase
VDFEQGLAYLYSLQRFGIKLGLENIQALLGNLADPQSAVPCVHVAGTNGKGSVCTFLAEILRFSGLQVGLYTSPHLHCFTERIRIAGRAISRDFAAALAEEVQVASRDLPVTFFEATTAMALLAFQRSGVDVAVMETGLGGRLDATNVIQPALSMITPVSPDHQEHLGASLAEIAAEKAGIIKPGTPVVVGRQESEALEVLLTVAAQRSAPVCLAGRDYRWQGTQAVLSVEACGRTLDGLSCSLAGEHQLDNFSQAVAGALTLGQLGWTVTDAALYQAGQSTFWPGRLEWWTGPPGILLDAAHNIAGITSLVAYLRLHGINDIPVLIGLSGGRCPEEILKPLVGRVRDVYAVPVPVRESVDPQKVVDWARSHGIPARAFGSPGDGFSAALQKCQRDVPLVVCGSLFLVAAVRELLAARFPDKSGRPGLPASLALSQMVSLK